MKEFKWRRGIRFVAEDGKELAIYHPEQFDRRCNKKPESLRFNRDIFDLVNHKTSEPYVTRALPQYATDVQTIIQMYPNAKISE